MHNMRNVSQWWNCWKFQNYYASRRSIQDSECGRSSVSQRTSFQHDSPQNSSKAGVVITSFRQSQRRWVKQYVCKMCPVH